MRIAQVSPLFESVPPRKYGGTERVVSYLTEELVRLGHEVTLFASGDSVTTARLRSPCARSLRENQSEADSLVYHFIMLEQLWRERHEFDLLHFHIDYVHFPKSRSEGWPSLTTLHGRLDLPELDPLFREYREMPVISISKAQRKALPWLNWVRNVPHGLPKTLYRFHASGGEALAFVGRASPEKGMDRAIEIARRSARKLRIAAKVDNHDYEFYKAKLEPLLKRSPHVEFLGEIDDREKESLMGESLALLFPIDWPEPFGLVMIESLACGTPVIPFPCGSVPEIMVPGRTGFIARDIPEAARMVCRLEEIDRRECRKVFEERFTIEVMARNYLEAYQLALRQPMTDGPAACAGSRSDRGWRLSASVSGSGEEQWTSSSS